MSLRIGCIFNSYYINHLLYADDVILLCPSRKGLQKLIDVTYVYGQCHDIKFNPMKTKCMCFSSIRNENHGYSPLLLGDEPIEYCNRYKYLGHVLTSNLRDDDDIIRQTSHLYARGNMLIRHFDKCSEIVKVKLFKSYVSNIYCSQLWCSFKAKSMSSLKVAYNNIFRRFFHLPRHINGITCSVSEMFRDKRIPCFDEIVTRM